METGASSKPVLGAILAGGLARRMGADGKSHLQLAGRPLIEHVIERVQGQVDALVINAPEDAAGLAGLGLPVVPDLSEEGRIETRGGPLVGILSALEWATASQDGFETVAVFPTDTPLLPEDFVTRARVALAGGRDLACAASGGRVHPVVALWPIGLTERLRHLVIEAGLRRADGVLEHFRTARVDYATEPFDPFFNVNTPEDLAEAERILAAMRPSG